MMAKKGGVGKSTVTVLLHESLRKAGHSVAVSDWDAQGTSSRALGFLQGQMAQPGATYDFLLYDTPPSLDHTATRTAVEDADVVLVVTSPDPADLWEASEAVQFAKARSQTATVRLVLNKVRQGTRLGRLIHESVQHANIDATILEPMLSYRECYKHAIGGGWGVLDSRAREEVLLLALAIKEIK